MARSGPSAVRGVVVAEVDEGQAAAAASQGELLRCGNDRAKPGGFVYKLALPGGVRMVAVEPVAGGGARIQLVRLLLRGAESDLVLPDVTAEMLTRGPGSRGQAQVVEVAEGQVPQALRDAVRDELI